MITLKSRRIKKKKTKNTNTSWRIRYDLGSRIACESPSMYSGVSLEMSKYIRLRVLRYRIRPDSRLKPVGVSRWKNIAEPATAKNVFLFSARQVEP